MTPEAFAKVQAQAVVAAAKARKVLLAKTGEDIRAECQLLAEYTLYTTRKDTK